MAVPCRYMPIDLQSFSFNYFFLNHKTANTNLIRKNTFRKFCLPAAINVNIK